MCRRETGSNILTTDNIIIIDNNHYKFKVISNFDSNLQNSLEFWYMDLLNYYHLSNLRKKELIYHLKKKLKDGTIDRSKFEHMVAIYGK